MTQESLVKVRNLTTSFRINGQYYAAVDGVNLDVYKNEVLALVGESGCGKSAMALSFTRLHNMNYTQIQGEILFDNKDLLSMSLPELNTIRGGKIGMIFQDPLTAMNPLARVGAQIEETLTYHTNLTRLEKKDRTIELLDKVGIVNPPLTYNQFPHELSGGMRQRAMIAMAIAASPDLIIADEPTTALDVTIQAQILDLLDDLRMTTGGSMVLITHDLGVVADIADRVAVMYAGQIVETASVYDLFDNPLHPYTRSLLHSMPSAMTEEARLHTIQGFVPSLQNLPRTGCRFAERIPWQKLHQEVPTYHEVTPGHFVLCDCYKTFNLGV